MFEITNKLTDYIFYSNTLTISAYYDELSLLEDSVNNIKEIDTVIISLDRYRVSNSTKVNALFLEFILYLIYLDEIPDEVDELYFEYIKRNYIFDEMKHLIDKIEYIYKNISNHLASLNINLLLNLGFRESSLKHNRIDTGFVIGYKGEREINDT